VLLAPWKSVFDYDTIFSTPPPKDSWFLSCKRFFKPADLNDLPFGADMGLPLLSNGPD
jgi:hypothetical protein